MYCPRVRKIALWSEKFAFTLAVSILIESGIRSEYSTTETRSSVWYSRISTNQHRHRRYMICYVLWYEHPRSGHIYGPQMWSKFHTVSAAVLASNGFKPSASVAMTVHWTCVLLSSPDHYDLQGCQQLSIKKFPDFSLTFPWPLAILI